MPSPIHDKAIELAVAQQIASKAKFEGKPNDIVRDALFVIAHDAIAVHRAIAVLLATGWPAPSAALLRTLLDMLLSTLAIVRGPKPSTAAFKYLYSGIRRHSRNQQLPGGTRRSLFKQIRTRITSLPADQRSEALSVLKDKDRPYWFSPDFANPTELATKLGSPELAWIYHQLSGAAHGTFLGMRLYREHPDARSINPETPGRRTISVDLSSCRFLLQILELREEYEQLGTASQFDAFRQALFAMAQEHMADGAT